MKYKKYSYILVIILMLVIGVDSISAVSENHENSGNEKYCYYISDDDSFKASLRIGYNFESKNPNKTKDIELARVTVVKLAEGNSPLSQHFAENWFNTKNFNGISIPKVYDSKTNAISVSNPICPKYIVYTTCPANFLGLNLWWDVDSTFATSYIGIPEKIVNASKDCKYAKYASNYKNGHQITKDEFYTGISSEGLIEYDGKTGEYTCETMDTVFGSKNDPESIRYMLNEILSFVRIIVPILIILLGTIDFAKAVIAGKEENMKKAQKDFIRRVIAGVVVFLVPTLVDIIMSLAEIVWQGTSYVPCDF